MFRKSPSIRDPAARRARQRLTLAVFGIGLIGAGVLLLIVLQRVPLPLRVLMGSVDIIAGSTLLVLRRNKFSAKRAR